MNNLMENKNNNNEFNYVISLLKNTNNSKQFSFQEKILEMTKKQEFNNNNNLILPELNKTNNYFFKKIDKIVKKPNININFKSKQNIFVKKINDLPKLKHTSKKNNISNFSKILNNSINSNNNSNNNFILNDSNHKAKNFSLINSETTKFSPHKIRYLNFRPFIDLPKNYNINNNENNNNKENENNNNNKKNENKKINNEVKYYYKILGNECLLVKNLLEDNGFIQTVNNNDFSILWASGHIKLNVFPYCEKFQKLNHFPRSGELTRKDLLYKNLSKLKASFPGSKFDFLPISFLIPNEIGFLNDEMKKDNNKKLWIIKPCASSQGRGIYLTNNIKDIDGNYKQIASKYIDNPFTINKKKFDLRIYVLVTSIVPLKIYRFNEGLTRFATDNYNINIYDKCSHLTNYAINKNNKNYIQNENLENNNYNTSKWSLTQFKNFLNSNKINSDLIFNKIDDIIIKTLISVENNLFTAMEKYTNFYNNCFELFGFDILIDENLNPWLMEVNLSPNLHYDSPIDLKIKGEMIAEIFDIIRIVPYDMRNENIYENNNKFKEVNKLIKINELKDIKFNKEIKEKIWDYIEEVKRLKGFIKLFPNKKYNEYKKFFDKEREINVILGILENKYN